MLTPALSTVRMAMSRAAVCFSRRPVIGYIGWLGHGNLGDEAMYLAIRRLLAPAIVIPFGGNRKERLLAHLRLGGPRIFDAVILGGGTLINPGYLPVVRRALDLGLPLYAFGTGVGSSGFSQEADPPLDGWAAILPYFRNIGVRGPISKSRLEALGAGHVEMVGDPALSHARENIPVAGRRRRLVVNLAGPAGASYGEGSLACHRSVAHIARLFRHGGGEVVGVALGDGHKTVLRDFARDVGVPDRSLIEVGDSIEALFETVQGSVALIGVKLHSAVLACCVGVPPILFKYRDKCEDFMLSMGLERFLVPISAGERAVRVAWERVLAEGEGLRSTVHQRASAWHEKQTRFAEMVLEDLLKSGTRRP